ncbi:putative glycosyl transferase family 48 protein [Phytophthora sojae]|uniref:1,3-beta-glucan synthase n=1 Tax=Phytophthora sojae (strain P6497) TaxID=1094619 RepID=G4YK88_PHYSP|nr:putative glycosyl transferase family 48 protein [Phytophthora sojae]EGZ28172.1 putative glycosyl transferase family 48 protein [Phytophthora sojae]|eukprot:XP_009515447.1 putative glycosyl transferase family 48 protein [Phytophthora sojae]
MARARSPCAARLLPLLLAVLLVALLAARSEASKPITNALQRARQNLTAFQRQWIDPDTDPKFYNVSYTLIFSDEFNSSRRTFEAGFDSKWTAIDIRDTTNMGQHYFLPQAVQIDKGNLIITTSKPKERYRGAKYVSGSVQTWNKFCYTGGFVEVKAILPGKWGIPGTWPAIWLMGNLGRAPFGGSLDDTWPWSFDVCAPYVEKGEKVKQKINACGNLTDKHDKDSYPERYGMNPFQGRGASEIDVIEAQIRARDEPAYISTSLQIRPSVYDDMRPSPDTLPGPGQWYQGLKYGEFTKINSAYYGDLGLDSISALTQLESNAFKSYHLYRLDWSPGPEGYIRWWMDNNFLFEIPGEALNRWMGGVPPRQIPVEPSYLILSTAVSEKFSPPCEGQICNSLWPSNFTIDYVRVYQGNPNRYTSVGCNPQAYPTTEWIYAHPVDYGLPWYVLLRVDIGLLQLFAVINALVGLFMAFRGTSHPKMASIYASSLWLTASFYGALSAAAPDDLAWIQTALACLCGLVLGGVCCLVYPVSLGAMLGLYGGVMVSQFVPLLSTRVITAVLVGVGITLGAAPQVDTKHVVILSTSLLGSLAFLLSVSLWVSEGDIAANAWDLAGFVFNGNSDDHVGFCSEHCLAMYVLLLVLSATTTAFGYYRMRGVTLRNNTISARKAKFPPVSASSDARSWRPDDDDVSASDKNMVNFFSPTKLPHNMQQFSTIFRIAVNVQRCFGFQLDNFRNQTEHIVVLLTNNTRKGGNPYRKLHELVFSNYNKWCSKLEIQPLNWSEQRAPQGGLTSVDEISVDLCLFFFIWGEASNLRHSPEFLCFLFHKMKEEFPSIRHSEREAGHFLDTVVTPVYGLLRAEMTSKHDHEDRHNYDDFNEFFWSKTCLKFDYKHEEVLDTTSPSPALIYQQKKKQREGLGGFSSRGGLNGGAKSNNFFNKRKSIAEGFTESAKSFVEKRTWLLPLRAFNRIFNFHVISFHFLAVLAFANEQEMNFQDSCKIISSTLITPFLLDILRDGLDIFAVYHVQQKSFSTARNVMRVLLHLVLVVVSTMLYWYAWAYGGLWWQSYYTIVVLFHVPGLINCVMQVMPGLTNWTRRTKFAPVAFIRDIVSPMNRLYVGDNVLDPESMSLGYQFFWASQLAWKLYFSYKFEIYPLVVPTFLLFADHVENNVSMITTVFLIFLNWMPFFLVFCVDITIWNSIWMAFTGTFVGFSSHIGEIRNFSRVRTAFSRAVDAFNAKVIARNSKTGLQISESTGMSYGSTSLGHEVLDRVAGGADPTSRILSQRRTSVHDDETPLLSFSRRKQTPMERQAARRRKWFSFSVAWDTIIDSMRADDLISNKEKALLQFHRLDGYQREIYLPQFQLAGCFENFTSTILDIYSSNDGKVSERVLQDKLLEILSESPMVEESVEEIWELANWVLVNVLGPCHTNDVKYITSVLNSWAARGVFRALNLQKIAPCGRALAGLVSLLKSNVRAWKNNAKVIPVRKDPSDYASYEFPQQSSSYRPASTGLTKSASTTGLSSLGLEPPRRSRGSGVARIARMQQQTHKPSVNNGKSTHSIPSAHIMQIRERVRTFLNLGKEILAHVHEQDPVYAESKGISDRLTWILTQERGFMWDDNYTGEQITLTAFESHTDVVLSHLHGLLTLQKIDAEPQSYDARRRLLFFVNSLFMDMPLAPLLEEMKSWSVMTPFYAEDVLYSRKDLESKQDGLDVHTLLFLQTLYKRDWENFLERVKPKKNIWKDPESAIELRMWASLRGQTLSRTVQGMMYGEAAIRLLAEIEQVPQQKLEELINTKFTYVVACQIYGRQKKNNDPKASDIEFLLHRFPNLRVAYIDEVRVNYQKEQSYFSVLIKGGEELGSVHEIYRVRLPGNPILGEGKPENQNSAIVFTRGENLQTIDMNQDGYLEEGLKMRNLLEEFDKGTADRPYTIVGIPEHIFTGSVSSLANYMALQETSFVTLSQRTLARPLRMRLHYGHPDVFNKLFFITRGGISKANKGINLSEDIFAGYNNCMRGGSVAFPEYTKCGKGRDVGMQQIYKFEAKLAQGAAEQSLSRDVYRISQRLDFFKLLSFYYNHVGFYLSTSIIIWTVYILLYCNLLRSLLSLEGVGGREPVLLSNLQLMLGSVAFLTTAPLLATISVERGFKAALNEILVLFVTGGPLYFLFHIGTKWFYFGQTILAGGAKYRATGRGFVTKHSSFDELYRFYASSHLYAAVEIAIGLTLYYKFTVGHQYFAMTWSLWLVFASWYWSPFWFNPLSFEWSDVMEDFRLWFKWMRGDGGNPNQSWEAWFKEENAYFSTLRPWSKACVTIKGGLFALIAFSISSTGDEYHSILTESTWLPLVICCSMAAVYLSAEAVFFNSSRANGENGLVRFLKLLLVLVLGAGLVLAFVYVDGMWQCLLSMGYLAAAVGCWALVLLGSNSRFVGSLYFVHDAVLGLVSLSLILLLAALYVPGKIQTWLLYNNALSRGVVIEDILRANSSNDDRDDDLSVQQMRSIIIEQQRFINVLTASGSETDIRAAGPGKKEDLMHAMSDNTLNAVLRNMSESELSALQDSSSRLQAIMSEEERKVAQRKQQQEEQRLAEAGMNPSLSRTRRAFSTSDFSAIPPNASSFNLPNGSAAPGNGTTNASAANGPHAAV